MQNKFTKPAAQMLLMTALLMTHAIAAPTCTSLCVVDPTGNNVNSGDPAAPLLTIQAAVNQVAANGVVQVNAGTYTESVTVPKDDITIAGAGSSVVTLSAPVALTGIGIAVTGLRSNVHIRGLRVTNFSRGIFFGGGADNITNVSVRDSVASSNGDSGIVFQGTGTLQTVVISNVTASSNGAAGGLRRGLWMGFLSNRRVTIENGIFNSNALVGLDVNFGTLSDAVIRGNTVVGNGDSGLAVIGTIGPGATLIESNIVTDNGRFGIEVKNPAGSGASSGAGSVVLRGNRVSRTGAAFTDPRDTSGIAVFRRLPVAAEGHPAQPSGVWLERNIVTGYQRAAAPVAPLPASGMGDGLGIIVEGTGHTLNQNIVASNNVGIQLQSGNPDSTAARTTAQGPHFDRGDAVALGVTMIQNVMCNNTDFGLRKFEGATGVWATAIAAPNHWWRNATGFNPPGTGDRYSTSGNTLGVGNASLTVSPFMVSSTDSFLVSNGVCPIPSPPFAVADNVTTPASTPISISVLANDSDLNGDPLTVLSITSPTNGTASILPGGVVSYTPNPGFIGIETFTYTVSDGGLTSIGTIQVTVTNRPPVAVNDVFTIPMNIASTLNVLGNDSDPDGHPINVFFTSTPSNGVLAINPGGTGLTFTPNAGFQGTETITYYIRDSLGAVSSAVAQITVANRPPIAVNDTATTNAGSAVTINVLANDSDPDGHSLTISAATPPANGSLTVNPVGTISYTPNAGFSGINTFNYTISDGFGGSSTATVTVTVNAPVPVNRPPIAVNDTATTNASNAVTINVLANDSDPDGQPLTVVSVTQPANGTVAINPGGTVSYAPNAGFTGTNTFMYTISDGAGGTASASVTVAVNAPPPLNRPPIAVNDVATTSSGNPMLINVLANDSDPDGQPLIIVSVSQSLGGTTSTNPNGLVGFMPNPDFVGTTTFSYTISDGAGGTATATVTVVVNPALPRVTARDDDASTSVNQPINIAVLANDTVPSSQSGRVSVTIMLQPTEGTATVTANNEIRYTPNANFVGTDRLRYEVRFVDAGVNVISSATVFLVVFNQEPIAQPLSLTLTSLAPVPLRLAATDRDVNGSVSAFQFASLNPCLRVTIDGSVIAVDQMFSTSDAGRLQIAPTRDCPADPFIEYVGIDNLGLASAPAAISLLVALPPALPLSVPVPVNALWMLALLIGIVPLTARRGR